MQASYPHAVNRGKLAVMAIAAGVALAVGWRILGRTGAGARLRARVYASARPVYLVSCVMIALLTALLGSWYDGVAVLAWILAGDRAGAALAADRIAASDTPSTQFVLNSAAVAATVVVITLKISLL